jgi:sporulation protein YlmC with PRC-barrel domain
MKKNLIIAGLALAGLLSTAGTASAQVAGGTTTVGVSVTEVTELAMGWSVKKTLLGKNIYNESGDKVGKVEDLIISPEKSVSFVIVGAGGFVGIGRHDVAIPVTQIQNKAGKLVLPGATKDKIKALPAFDYTVDNTKRDAFIAAADKDIAKGKSEVADLKKKAGAAAADVKVRIDTQIVSLQADVDAAEAKLTKMKNATANRWREFEADVSAATSRLRQSVAKAVG